MISEWTNIAIWHFLSVNSLSFAETQAAQLSLTALCCVFFTDPETRHEKQLFDQNKQLVANKDRKRTSRLTVNCLLLF